LDNVIIVNVKFYLEAGCTGKSKI